MSFSMRGSALCLLLLSIFLVKAYVKSCKYWCKLGNRYYCCPSGKSESWSEQSWHSLLFPWFWLGIDDSQDESPWHEIIKKPKKHCPPLRTHCPRTYDWYKPPALCESNDDCNDWEKCCYDVCLEHKTCKDAE
ncbi:uncharacterized protein LOC116841893 [Odontomachus brunneus]|uniref:uncharacterized protein LOC116841893 n=1 Tax=Odontomachus brunneus TaxID=486640 RepID=UPI0013F2B06D|nr:uncharacterized protein LOC116841893 [Odontomachus brunneus]